MGTNKEENQTEKKQGSEPKKTDERTCIGCLWSLMVSMAGGLMLGWWEYEYHPTNTQQWMVPLGLILFVTPVIASFAVFVSETFKSMEVIGRNCEPLVSLDHGAVAV